MSTRILRYALSLLALLLLSVASPPPVAAASRRERKEVREKIAQLPQKYQVWLEEHELLRRIGPVIAPVEAPFGPRLAQRARGSDRRPLYEQALKLAAATSVRA